MIFKEQLTNLKQELAKQEINTGYRNKNYQQKIEEVESLKISFPDSCKKYILEDIEELKQEFEEIYYKVTKLFKEKLECENKISENLESEDKILIEQNAQIKGKMSEFNLETAVKAIPVFRDYFRELEIFLKIVKI